MKLTEQIVIDKPPHEIASYLFDPTNDMKWIDGVSKVTLLTKKPIGVGTRVDRVTKLEGKKVEYVIQIHQLKPDHQMVMEAVEDTFPKKITYNLGAQKDSGTLVSITIEGELAAAKGIGGLLVKPLISNTIKKDLKQLKKNLEG